jgi:WD40 repeat protein
MKPLIYLLLTALCLSCSRNSTTEKYQNNRNNIVNVHDKIREINTGDIYIGSVANLHLMDKYLFIVDYQAFVSDRQVHIFDKNTFEHVASIATKGEGPGEFTRIGRLTVNERDRMFYITDYGRYRVSSYHLDSVLADPLSYMPKEKTVMNEAIFPHDYIYINDTLCIGQMMEPVSNSDFRQSIGKWNMTTGEITMMPYDGPKGIHKKRATFAASTEHNIYVECHRFYNLITICNLDGELICNVFGPNWDKQYHDRIEQYDHVKICGDKIVAIYLGERYIIENNRPVNLPTRLLVFDLGGNYIRTIDTGYGIKVFNYDPDNHRLILNLDEEMQFAYLDLDGLI